jgi:branched-chain amino acid aminotransferase
LAIDELLQMLATGECSEVFACVTAAIVSPIGVLADSAGAEHVPQHIDGVAAELREALLAIQERRDPDLFRWTRTVPPWANPR